MLRTITDEALAELISELDEFTILGAARFFRLFTDVIRVLRDEDSQLDAQMQSLIGAFVLQIVEKANADPVLGPLIRTFSAVASHAPPGSLPPVADGNANSADGWGCDDDDGRYVD